MNGNTESRVTNLEYLNSLSKGNTKFVQEMLRIFLLETPDELQVLQKSIDEKDFALIKATAHRLRSTIPFVGLDRLIEREVAEIEEWAEKRINIQNIASNFVKIKKICEQACLELTPI